METLRSAVLCACMLSAAVGMLSMICPGRKLERQMRFLISLLFAVSLAVPIARFELPPELSVLAQEELTAQTQAMDERVRTALIEQTQARAEQALIDALQQRGITCEKLHVSVHFDENNCIYISKVTAQCEDFAGANKALADLLGEEVEVSVTQILQAVPEP